MSTENETATDRPTSPQPCLHNADISFCIDRHIRMQNHKKNHRLQAACVEFNTVIR